MKLDNIKLFVFDVGGTLMEYKGMHLSWAGYYKSSFEYVNEKLELGLSDQQIATSVQIFTDYNPAVNPREKEIDPEIIFGDIIKGWGTTIPVMKIIFDSIIFPDFGTGRSKCHANDSNQKNRHHGPGYGCDRQCRERRSVGRRRRLRRDFQGCGL